MIERHLSRRELALVACALLVPIPVLAASGLGIPLPSAVERAVASLLPLPGSQETSVPTLELGTAAAADGSTGGQPTTEGRAAVPDSASTKAPDAGLRAGTGQASTATTTRSGGTGSEGGDEDGSPPTGGDEAPTPPEGPLPGPLPGPEEPEPAADTPAAAAQPTPPTLEIAVDGPDVSVEAVVGDDVGVSVDVGGAESPLDVDVTLPGPGFGIP
jgi:hypothetical protein